MSPEQLQRAQRGEADAREAFLREVGPAVASLVRRLGDRRDVQDQLHDVFMHLLDVLPRFDPRGPATLSTWVFTIAHRFVLDERKRFKPTLVPVDTLETHAHADADGETTAARTQLRDALERALATLPDEQRRPVVLVHVFDHSLDEVAAVEDAPVGTIKSRLFRARVALSRVLGPEFLEDHRHG